MSRRSQAPHARSSKTREDKTVLGVIYDPINRKGLTTRQLAEACGRDYINNVNKRAAKWYRRLVPWVIRVRVGREDHWYPRFPQLSPTEAKAQWQKRYSQ